MTPRGVEAHTQEDIGRDMVLREFTGCKGEGEKQGHGERSQTCSRAHGEQYLRLCSHLFPTGLCPLHEHHPCGSRGLCQHTARGAALRPEELGRHRVSVRSESRRPTAAGERWMLRAAFALWKQQTSPVQQLSQCSCTMAVVLLASLETRVQEDLLDSQNATCQN